MSDNMPLREQSHLRSNGEAMVRGSWPPDRQPPGKRRDKRLIDRPADLCLGHQIELLLYPVSAMRWEHWKDVVIAPHK